MPDELLTINQAARRLNIRAADLRHLLQDQKLPAIETKGRQWRISATALQEFIQRDGVHLLPLRGPLRAGFLPAARGLLGWQQEDLAKKAGVSTGAIRRMEQLEGPIRTTIATLEKVLSAFESAGIVFIEQGVAISRSKLKAKGE